MATGTSVVRQKVFVRRDEYLMCLEILEGQRIRYFSYTYYVNHRGTWVPSVRWDNAEQQPHVDRYDENGSLLDQHPCREKNYREVLKLVQIFRRNLSTMNLGEL